MCFEKYTIILSLFFFSQNVVYGQQISYACVFSDIIRDCDDFDNDLMDFKVSMTPSGIDTSLCGTVTINEDINQLDKFQMQLEMFRDVDGVLQYFGSNIIEFCNNIADPESVWFPFTNAMGVTNCPVEKGTYETCDIVIDLSKFESYMKADYIGEYSVIFRLLKPVDPMTRVPSMPSKIGAEQDMFEIKSCHEVYVTIVEYNEE